MSVARRLSETLASQGRSMRWLQRVLSDAGTPASSYGSVRAYVTGQAEPRQDWLDAAAEALEIRAEWLSSGEGEITQVDQVLAEAALNEEGAESREPDIDDYKASVEALRACIHYGVAGEPESPFITLPSEVAVCVERYLFRYYLARSEVGRKPTSETSLGLRMVDLDRMKVGPGEVEQFVRRTFADALAVRPQGSGPFASAVLSQLAVLYLRHYGRATMATPREEK